MLTDRLHSRCEGETLRHVGSKSEWNQGRPDSVNGQQLQSELWRSVFSYGKQIPIRSMEFYPCTYCNLWFLNIWFRLYCFSRHGWTRKSSFFYVLNLSHYWHWRQANTSQRGRVLNNHLLSLQNGLNNPKLLDAHVWPFYNTSHPKPLTPTSPLYCSDSFTWVKNIKVPKLQYIMQNDI